MTYILDGFRQAFGLILSGDMDVYSILFRSLYVSVVACVLSALFSIPIGIVLGLKNFRGKSWLIRLLFTMMSTPTVVIGLVVALMISRNGPLGILELMYTSNAMIIAQFILVSPLLIGLVYSVVNQHGLAVKNTGRLLGANSVQLIWLVAVEIKSGLIIALITAFSRAISEVGTVAIVGGNIAGHTRVMTTAIVMHNSMGNYGLSIALGLILLVISFSVNSFLYSHRIQRSL